MNTVALWSFLYTCLFFFAIRHYSMYAMANITPRPRMMIPYLRALRIVLGIGIVFQFVIMVAADVYHLPKGRDVVVFGIIYNVAATLAALEIIRMRAVEFA